MPIVKNNETYLTTEEACRFLGVTRQTINELVRDKRLQKYKQGIGRNVLYKQVELEALTDVYPIDTEDR